jgi:hypothetical protein
MRKCFKRINIDKTKRRDKIQKSRKKHLYIMQQVITSVSINIREHVTFKLPRMTNLVQQPTQNISAL